MLRSMATILLISAMPLSVAANDISAAAICAEKLGPVAKQIYDLAAPDVTETGAIKDILIAKLKPLVISGEMDRNRALAEAPNAGECLKLLQ